MTGGLCVLLSSDPTLATGVYIDAAGDVAFLTAPQSRSLAGRIVRSNDDVDDATLFFIDATFPVRTSSLVELDIPVVSTLDSSEVVTEFGDVLIRARTRLHRSPGRVFHLFGALRTGTGTTRVWPYSSGSIDLEAGIAYVDTFDLLNVWGWGSGVYVGEAPESVPEDRRYSHYGRVSAGLTFPFAANSLNVGLGFMAAFFEAGRSRELLYAAFNYRRSQWLTVTVFAHVEVGASEERVSDYASGGGFRVFY